MNYEIRLRENVWDNSGGWHWRLYVLPGLDVTPKVVGWGWALAQADALAEANNQLNSREEENGRV